MNKKEFASRLGKIKENIKNSSIDNPYAEDWEEHLNGTKGSFIKHLAHAFQQADLENLKRLDEAFPEVSKAFHLWKSVGKASSFDEYMKSLEK